MALAIMSGIVLALRTASRAMKLSQMKTDFVSNVSHELRTAALFDPRLSANS